MIRFLSILSIISLFNCARTTQPNGGPKDIDPPALLNSVPIDGQKKFSGKNIEIEFDEAIKLKDPKEEILITPTAGPDTKFSVKKNKLTITPQLAWKENTTYSIAFREGVQDLNESNPADNLHLAFSTGETIDSLQITGTVDEAFIEKIPEKITVAAYDQDTFDIYRHRPTYFTKTDKKGRFTIRNLKPGYYYLYAFDDKNKNFKVDSKSERYGFNTKPASIPDDKDSIRLSIFRCDARQAKVTSIRNTNSISTIRFNKLLSTVTLKAARNITYFFGDNNGEIIVPKDFDLKDSLQVQIQTLDSLQEKTDTIVFIKYTDSKKIEEKLKLSEWDLKFNLETKALTARTKFNKPLKNITFDSIYIQIDTAKIQSITPKDITFDTITKKLTITKNLEVTDDETLRPNPVLVLGKAAFISTDQDSTKAQQLNVKIPKNNEIGMMTVEVQTDKPNYIITLLSSSSKSIESFTNQKKYTFKNIPAGDYKIIVHVDDNNDKQWNPGNFKKQLQPEKVFFYKFLGKKYSEPIRANWEVGPFLITF